MIKQWIKRVRLGWLRITGKAFKVTYKPQPLDPMSVMRRINQPSIRTLYSMRNTTSGLPTIKKR